LPRSDPSARGWSRDWRSGRTAGLGGVQCVQVGVAAGTVAGVVGAAAGDGVGRLQLALALAWRRRLLLWGLGRRQLYVLERLCLGERLRWLPLGLVISFP